MTEDNVLKLPLERRRLSEAEKKILDVSDEIDALLTKHVAAGDIELRTLAGLMAHRLGALLARIDRKQELWEVCEKIAKDQAKVS